MPHVSELSGDTNLTICLWATKTCEFSDTSVCLLKVQYSVDATMIVKECH